MKNSRTKGIACLLTAALSLAACGAQETEFTAAPAPQQSVSAPSGPAESGGEALAETERPASVIDAMAESTQFANPSEFHPCGKLELLTVDAWVDGYASQDGYYRMIPREDGSLNLCYIDFATRQEVYLCSQPNCTHDSDACTAWFPTAIGLHIALPVGDQVIVVHGGVQYYDDVLGEERLPRLEIMEPDGSARKQLFTFPASSSIASLVLDSMARDDENLYFCVENHTEQGRSRALCAVSSRTGKVFQLADLPEVEQIIVGTDGSALIFSYATYQYSVGKAISEVPVQVARYEPGSGEMTPLFEQRYTDVGECRDGQYWLLCSDGFLRDYDLKTGALVQERSVEFPDEVDRKSLCSLGLFDGKLMVYEHRANAGDAPSELFYYAVDTQTGEALRLEHVWKDDGGTEYPGRVAAQIGADFLFIHSQTKKPVAYLYQDGTSGTYDWPVYQYAFQPAASYWNNSQTCDPVAEHLE